MEPVLGVNIPGGTNLAALDGALSRITADGWQAAELNLSSCPLIMGGQLQEKVVLQKFYLQNIIFQLYQQEIFLEKILVKKLH